MDLKKKEDASLIFNLNKDKLIGKILIGVTGTCGKTSVSTILYDFLRKKKKTIYYGSNGIFKETGHIDNPNTTCSLQEFFKNLSDEFYVIVEISSISFYEYRLFGINFNYLILTNIYKEHLEYHKSFNHYLLSKLSIFSTNFNAIAIIPKNIKYVDLLLRLNYKTILYDLNLKVKSLEKGYSFDYLNESFYTPFIAKFNIYNLIPAIELLKCLNYSFNEIKEFISKFDYIDGRMMKYHYKDFQILIDYPHTLMAFKEFFKAISCFPHERIISVFGLGGDRYKERRKDIGRVIEKNSNIIVVTKDNPRFEDEMEIFNDIKKGFKMDHPYISKRSDAIDYAIHLAKKNDIVCILGRGNEKVIHLKDENIEFSDMEYIEKLCHIS